MEEVNKDFNTKKTLKAALGKIAIVALSSALVASIAQAHVTKIVIDETVPLPVTASNKDVALSLIHI